MCGSKFVNHQFSGQLIVDWLWHVGAATVVLLYCGGSTCESLSEQADDSCGDGLVRAPAADEANDISFLTEWLHMPADADTN